MSDDWGEPIYVYTREDAINDGVLILDPLVKLAEEAGFKQPVVFTAALWTACESAHGDVEAWVWDVLFLSSITYRQAIRDADDEETHIGPLDFKLKIGTTVRTVWLSWNSHEAFTFMFPEDY